MNTPMVAWVTQSWTKRYLVGDRVHVSGVIAVIACSMYMSRKNPGFMSPQVRLQTTAVWDALTFVLNGIVFVLIGLQLPCDGADWRYESHGPTGVWSRFQP